LIDEQLNREDRTGKLVRMEEKDWVEASSAMALHQMIHKGLKDEGEAGQHFTYYGEPGSFNVDAALGQAKSTQEMIFESQFEDVKFHDTADDLFDGGIKDGATLTIRVVPEDQKLSGSWHQVARTWLQQTNGQPKNLTFDKFSVQSLNEPDQERYQIVQTFGGDFVYGFGRQPRIMQLTGSVVNGKIDVQVNGTTRSMDWKNALQRRYDRFYRLTRCIHNKQKILIYAEDTVYSGYLLNMQTFTNAETQSMSQVTLSFIIKKKHFARQNDDAIPGFVNDEGRTVTDKTVPDEFLQDAQKEDYIRENLLPEVRRLIETQQQRVDAIIPKIKRLSPATFTNSQLKESAGEVGADETYKVGYSGGFIPVHFLYEPFDFPEVEGGFTEQLAGELGQKISDILGQELGQSVDDIIQAYSQQAGNKYESDVGQQTSVLSSLKAAYRDAQAGVQGDQAINQQEQHLSAVESSFEKKIEKANTLARRLVRTQQTKGAHEDYIQALAGT